MELTSYYFISSPITESLSQKERDVLLSHSTEKKYPRGSVLFEEGSVPKGVYIIERGKVKIFQRTLSGSDQIMNIHVAGEVIGYRPLLCNERYPVTAIALEVCTVTFIPKKDFLALLKKSFALSNTLLKFLSHEFTVWVNTISVLARTTVRERLLLNILILTLKYREKLKWPIRISLSKADLAGLIGTSNETLARMLRIVCVASSCAMLLLLEI
jgi:CRP-like cAMP-binding protein